MLALAGPDTLVVTRSMSAVNPPKRIAIVNRVTMKGDEVDVIFPRPHPVAASKNGYAYTGSLGVNQIASVSLADQRVEIIPVAGATHAFVQFALSPDESTLVGVDRSVRAAARVRSGAARETGARQSIPVGKMAFDPAFTPDGGSSMSR